MKTATPELIAFLQSADKLAMCDLYEFETLSGVSYYASSDIDIDWNGHTYVATGETTPLFSRDSIDLVRGLEVDTMKITVKASPDMYIEGLPFVQAVVKGALNDCRITIKKAFFADFDQPIVGVVHLFSGGVSDTSGSRNQVQIEAKSEIEILTVEFPRNNYQAACVHTTYGAGCGVQRASFLVTSAAASGATTSQVPSALAQAEGWFDQGVLKFTSGPNAGYRRTVKSFSGGLFKFALPWPFAAAASDTFEVLPGCDKTQPTCLNKFNNLARRKGYNYVPAAETVY